MESLPILFLSNRLDRLAQALSEAMEQDGWDCFKGPRLILTADAGIKPWLALQLAKYSARKGIASFKIFSWEEGIKYLLNQPGKEPSYLQLYLSIYQALQNNRSVEINEYVGVSVEKLNGLAKELTDLFLTYGYYGKNLFSSGGSDWQNALLKELFISGRWRAPVQLLLAPQKKKMGPVYCFDCPSLPPVVWDFLLRLELKIFSFSPCLSYWGDECTDLEKRKLTRYWKKKGEEKLEALQTYLLDSHPLLANLGKLGRDTFHFLDQYEIQIEECYKEPLNEPATLLEQLQKDLLFHEVSHNLDGDFSIQVNQTGTSRLREIEVLRDEIIRAHERKIPFAEMLILAPDIEVYAPLIELIFSDPEIGIPYQIAGIDQLAKNACWQGFKQFLQVAQSCWEVDSLLKLFENFSFREKQGWDIEKLDRIRTWIQQSGIRWGRDPEQKKKTLMEVLGKENESKSRGTWEEGGGRLLSSLVYLFPEDWTDLPIPSPIEGVALSDADEVEQLLMLLEELKKDSRELSEGILRTVESWAEFLSGLFKKYFSAKNASSLEEIFYAMRSASVQGIAVPFSALSFLFSKKSSGQIGSSLLHAVRFAPLKEGFVTSCRALFLIGQDEGQFPKQVARSSLDLLNGSKEFPPLPFEKNRYLFLQAISLTQDQIVMSYGHVSAEDGKEIGPSIVLRELLSYLDKKVPVVVHPNFALHKKCFEKMDVQSKSKKMFRAAVKFYEPKKPLQFFSPFNRHPSEFCSIPEEGDLVISLKDLKSFFQHPWRFYLQKQLNLRIEEREEKQYLSDFEVSFIKRAQILKAGLDLPLDMVIGRFAQKENFPVGLFGKMACVNLHQMSEEWKGHLQEFELEGFPLKTLSFSDLAGGEFSFPPLELQIGKLHVKLVGEIKLVSLKGPIHSGDDSFSTLLRSWPEYLAVLCALQSHSIFCLRSGKVKTVESPRDALERCIELYLLGLETPLPLLSEWAEALVKKEHWIDLQKKIDTRRPLFEDPIYDWIEARMEPVCAETLFSTWSPFLKEKLNSLIRLYPSRSKEKV
jgi:exonuclease V gamma subunit